jgi:hypothetical protein
LPRQIPEPFIWLVAKAMAECIYNLQTGMVYFRDKRMHAKAEDLATVERLLDATSTAGPAGSEFPPLFSRWSRENMAEYVDLLEANKILEGHEDARPSGPPGRKEIVYRNIKPANIFLREPVSPYESYPRPVFGDLDGLLRLNDKNRLKKKGRLRSETYTAPVSTCRDRTHLPRYFNVDYSIWKTVTGPTGNSKTNISLAKQTYGA